MKLDVSLETVCWFNDSSTMPRLSLSGGAKTQHQRSYRFRQVEYCAAACFPEHGCSHGQDTRRRAQFFSDFLARVFAISVGTDAWATGCLAALVSKIAPAAVQCYATDRQSAAAFACCRNSIGQP